MGNRRSQVLFRLVVFRPFVSEVLFGKVKSSSEDGIRGKGNFQSQLLITWVAVSLGFFDDMHVPRIFLPTPSAL